MHRLGALALAMLAACGGDDGNASDGDPPDAGPCEVNILFDPPMPLLGMHPQIRATAEVTQPGNLDYLWEVRRDGQLLATQPAQAGSLRAIRFDAPEAGVYTARVTVPTCFAAERDLTVEDPAAPFVDLRLRVIPPAGVEVPPIDRMQRVFGGGDKQVTAYLDRGVIAPTRVVADGTAVAAYVRFAPLAQPAAVVEAFSTPGGLAPRLLAQDHGVLVIPVSQALAPVQVARWSPTAPTDLVVTAGQPVGGTILDGAGAPIAGATVQLVVAGVPTTYATTSASGAFTVRASVLTGATTIAVTPPAATGLPRLSLTTSALDLAQPLVISYAPIAMRDLAGTSLQHGGARVVFTGSYDACSVATGGAPIPARGSVRVTAVADPSGLLPTTLVPAVRLTAVITSPDPALAPVDLTGAVPALITAPTPTPFTTTVTVPGGGGAPGSEVVAVPLGELAAAGVQPVRFTADLAGTLTGELAAGGRYQLRLRDPAGRMAARVVEVEANAIAASYELPPSLTLFGELVLSDSDAALDGALVQLLCGDCPGSDRPLAETRTAAGAFTVSVPDMGVQ